MVKSSKTSGYEKKKDLLRFLMLVAVEAIFVRTAKTTISIIKSNIVGHIDWNGFEKYSYHLI